MQSILFSKVSSIALFILKNVVSIQYLCIIGSLVVVVTEYAGARITMRSLVLQKTVKTMTWRRPTRSWLWSSTQTRTTPRVQQKHLKVSLLSWISVAVWLVTVNNSLSLVVCLCVGCCQYLESDYLAVALRAEKVLCCSASVCHTVCVSATLVRLLKR